jgi:hypothetical protein
MSAHVAGHTFNFGFQYSSNTSGENMKNLTRLCAATVLMLALAFSTLAGQISTPVVDPPPPPSPSTPTNATDGQISMGKDNPMAGGSVTDITISVLQNVLALL